MRKSLEKVSAKRNVTSRRKIGRTLVSGVAAGCLFAFAGCGNPEQDASSARALSVTPDPAKTVTIDVHGWNLSGAKDDGMVGDDRGGGSTVDGIRKFSGLPHGQVEPTAKNQIIATEYYGSTFPAYYTAADISQVSVLKGVPRYAAIVAKYARYVLNRSGADAFNLTCHSMGCLISRYIIENDVERVVSDGKMRRWVSFAGVVGGARLADLDSGRWIDPLAKLFGIDLIDVQHMSYPWVTANVATYDHLRPDGNNPNFGGLLIHHILSTDPKIDTAWSIPLLDGLGYSKVPNDGIVLDDEMFLHDQASAARYQAPSGDFLPSSRSHHFADHFTITDISSSQALAAAAIVGSRRVKVTLKSVTLIKDNEHVFLDTPPAEVVVESTVKYPYVTAIDPSDPLLDEVTMERRNAPVLSMSKGETRAANLLVYEGPVFDAQTSVALNIKLSETDFYPAGGVTENRLSSPATLGTFTQEVPVSDGDYTTTTGDVSFTVHVAVERLY